VRTIDIAPTLLQVAGLKAPAGFQGQSLLPLMQKPGKDRISYARLMRAHSYKLSIIRDGYKLILMHKRNRDESEVYFLPDDPGERNPLQDQNPDVAARLSQEVLKWSQQPPLSPPAKLEKQLDEGQEEQLRALGYVD
jgi:arylsulfatase A-like enzyme